MLNISHLQLLRVVIWPIQLSHGCLLGVNGGLYYVRNGTLNDYALTFNLPLRPDIIDIYFNWNASTDQSPVRTSDVTGCTCIETSKYERSKTNNSGDSTMADTIYRVGGADGQLKIILINRFIDLIFSIRR